MNRTQSIVLLLLALLLATFVLAACQPPIGDPYQMGQWARQQVEQMLEDLKQFLAGFCGAPAASAAGGALVAAWLIRKKG